MKRNTRIGLVVSTLAAAVLVTLVFSSVVGGTQAAPVGPAVSQSNQWAYGGQRWVNVSASTEHGTYAASAYFGWQVVLTATNTSATTVELEAQRSLGVSFEAQYCAPDCKDPNAQGQVSIIGYESDTAFANMSSQGTVYENGSATSAMALLNTSSSSHSKLNESLNLTLSGSNGTHTASGTLNVTGSSSSQVAFGTSGLGLVPWNALPGMSWNATGAFNGSGAWALDYTLSATGFNGTSRDAAATIGGTVNATGTLAVLGSDLGNITLNNGQTVPRIVVTVIGPFDVMDGVIFVPHDFNVFNADPRPWSTGAPGIPSVATGEVDYVIDHVHHAFHIAAAMTNYSAQSASIVDAVPSGAVQTAAQVSTDGVGVTSVQAQPETVAQAQAASQCYASGCEAMAVHASSSPPFKGVISIALIGLAVASIVGVVAVLEWRARSRRRASENAPPPAVTANYPAANVRPSAYVAPPPPPPPDPTAGSGPKLPP